SIIQLVIGVGSLFLFVQKIKHAGLVTLIPLLIAGVGLLGLCSLIRPSLQKLAGACNRAGVFLCLLAVLVFVLTLNFFIPINIEIRFYRIASALIVMALLALSFALNASEFGDSKQRKTRSANDN